jgi:CBS domain-containing protein
VTGVERRQHKIIVSEPLTAGRKDPSDAKGKVLLKRDVLDALIIDLLNRTTTRATDLVLKDENGELRLIAVDTGIGAMLRRISRGLYTGVSRNALSDWTYVEFLRGDPRAVAAGAGYNMRIRRLPPGEIARLADFIPYLHAAELLTLLPDDTAAAVLEAMSLQRQRQVIEEFDEKQAVELLKRMSSDLASDLVGQLHVETMKRYLAMLPKAQSNRIIELLNYPEDSVGGQMVNNVVVMQGDATAGAGLEKLRRSHDVQLISLVFVVENFKNRKLRGALTFRDILEAEEDTELESLMDPYVATLNPFDPASEAAHRLIGSQVPAMPVTNADGRLLGAMTLGAAILNVAPSTSSLQSLRIFS